MDLIVSSLLPFVLLMVTGYAVKTFGWVKADSWASIEALSFKVFMPALVMYAIYSSDSLLAEMDVFLWIFIISVCLVGASSLLLRFIYSKASLSNASLSTIFQTSTRWNPFIIWPMVELIYGHEGISLLSITIAIFVPLVNIANIITVSVLNKQSSHWHSAGWLIVKNPIVIGCVIGLMLRYGQIDLPDTIDSTIKRLGECALVTILLIIGANLDLRRLFKLNQFVVISVAFKMLLLPFVFICLASFFNLSDTQFYCGILMTAVPTASNGYIIAKQMGGDGPLYANILTWQVVFSLFLLPFLIQLPVLLH